MVQPHGKGSNGTKRTIAGPEKLHDQAIIGSHTAGEKGAFKEGIEAQLPINTVNQWVEKYSGGTSSNPIHRNHFDRLK